MNSKIIFFLAAMVLFSGKFLMAQDITAYSWSVTTNYVGELCQGPLELVIPDGEPESLECYPQESYYFLSGGEWINNQWYGIIYDTWWGDCPLVITDTLTGSVDTIGFTTVNVVGIAHDYNSGITYGIDWDGNFFTIDISTGDVDVIGVSTANMIGLVCTEDGSVFALNDNDNLYEINKSTGEGTIIGSLGIDIAMSYCDMSYDFESDVLYAIIYSNTSVKSQLATIDILSGEATILNGYGDNELSSLAIRNDVVVQNHDLGIVNVLPTEADAGLSINPSVFIENLGSAVENDYTVEMVISDGINDVYSSTKLVTSEIMPNEQMEIELDDVWTPETVQTYTITTTLSVDDDEDLSNNTLISECDVLVGVNQIYKNAFSVYPIPSNGIITINTQDNLLITILNQQGQVIKTLSINSTTKVDLSGYSIGLYILNAIDTKGNCYTENILLK